MIPGGKWSPEGKWSPLWTANDPRGKYNNGMQFGFLEIFKFFFNFYLFIFFKISINMLKQVEIDKNLANAEMW